MHARKTHGGAKVDWVMAGSPESTSGHDDTGVVAVNGERSRERMWNAQ